MMQIGKIDRYAALRWFPITLIVLSAVLVFGGCSGGTAASLQLENKELKSKVNELEQIVHEKDAQIERYNKEYELRNILDMEARKLLSALNSGIFSKTEKELFHDNIVVKEDRLETPFENHRNEILFMQNKLDFEQVRQRFYHLDEQGRFITGYEVLFLSDNIQKRIDSRAVLVFTFIERPSGWKLADIGMDR
ncbi:MAG: hypothetical protein APF84_16215 [Gracilibacter sp. BRH_c7a]|nr:MAG: hypothetical protein APF84_16215 [Gracilibacter sp. BRH_c7a]